MQATCAKALLERSTCETECPLWVIRTRWYAHRWSHVRFASDSDRTTASHWTDASCHKRLW